MKTILYYFINVLKSSTREIKLFRSLISHFISLLLSVPSLNTLCWGLLVDVGRYCIYNLIFSNLMTF